MPQIAAYSAPQEFNLVVVGSGGVGKSCITVRFLKDEFTPDYDPTIEENYRKTVLIDGVQSTLNIVDTAGQQEYTALRDQHFSSGEGFLLVFALNEKSTFAEIQMLRKSILNLKDSNNVPFVLIGNKCDLPVRDVQKNAIDEFLSQTKMPYLETSAKENININESFQELVKEVRKVREKSSSKTVPTKQKGKCTIL